MIVPADVPAQYEKLFIENYNALTKGTSRVMIFAADQKMEHLNPLNPEDVFVLASSPHIGAFATHLGLIARYGKQYNAINYIVKLNGKTNLVPMAQKDPASALLWSMDQVVQLRDEAGLKIRGAGYTIYPGSEDEGRMFAEAAQVVYQAHQMGLVAIIWSYARGKSVRDDSDERVVAGSAGVAASLGADIVKIKVPRSPQTQSCAELLHLSIQSAGNTRVICSGGERQDPKAFLTELHSLLTVGKAGGCAVGRNIFQHNFMEALRMIEAISALVYRDCSLEDALKIIQ
jgi:DhnA family fructose-bisphosphate aldolase class Ia